MEMAKLALETSKPSPQTLDQDYSSLPMPSNYSTDFNSFYWKSFGYNCQLLATGFFYATSPPYILKEKRKGPSSVTWHSLRNRAFYKSRNNLRWSWLSLELQSTNLWIFCLVIIEEQQISTNHKWPSGPFLPRSGKWSGQFSPRYSL